jgi:lipopolysaccharide/colanic/teichoic acid biosynthesis glycosyltransferase
VRVVLATGFWGKILLDALTIDRADLIERAGLERYRPKTRQGAAHGLACRSCDIVLALFLIIFTAPLLVAISLAVKLSDGGPAFFAHQRIGRGGQSFKCLKFRTMVKDADERFRRLLESDPAARMEWANDHKLRVDPRITPVGGFLRRSSLDELPQLFNVLRGEMSIVGPRPIVAAEVVRYGWRFGLYCMVRPGITGLWQVSGRNDLSYRRRVAMDTLYAKRKSFGFDVQILLLTVPAVLLAKGSC